MGNIRELRSTRWEADAGREDAGVSIMSGGNDKEPRSGLVWCEGGEDGRKIGMEVMRL